MDSIVKVLHELEDELKNKNKYINELELKIKSLANSVISPNKENTKMVESKEVKCNKNNKEKESFYITTAIHYTNGHPHIGHAYENIVTDVIARYYRISGRNVFFLTGTDEHGQKIAQTAATLNQEPIELCNKYAMIFKQLTKDLNISNDDFIRTTSERHKKIAQIAFQKALDNGDIYLDIYKGWYNVREETFITEIEAKASDYKDPTTGLPLKQMEEESYFFRMSKYQDKLIQYYRDHPTFLQPETRKLEILKRLKEPLLDLSVSRTTFNHGIPLLNDKKHVMYVWFDALSNYLSGIDYYDLNSTKKHFWPASIHMIGKDIVWFHCVIWPSILMSLKLPLPKQVFAHGFINASDGCKMSKSIGNVIDPYHMIKKYSLESFRYFLIREPKFGQDMSFSETNFINIHNSELADALGNLAHRIFSLCSKYNHGKVPNISMDLLNDIEKPFNIEIFINESEKLYKDLAIQDCCLLVINAVKDTNKYLTDKEPWHMKDNLKRLTVVRIVLEAIYVIAHFLSPIIPETAKNIFKKLNTKPVQNVLTDLKFNYNNIVPDTVTCIGNILFEKHKTDDEILLIKQKEQEKKDYQESKKNKNNNNKDSNTVQDLFSGVDIRVGKITKVWHHPDSEKLFCEEIDIGSNTVLQIASGLRKFYTLDELENRYVLVLINLKPAKLGGFKSHGMVLCASNESHDKVEFIEPPETAEIGERIIIKGNTAVIEPLSAAQLKKQKVWEKVSLDLKTNKDKIATYKDQILVTSKTQLCCTSKTLIDSFIS